MSKFTVFGRKIVFSKLYGKVLFSLLITILLANTAFAQQPDTVFSENWESGIGNWYADQGVWEVGIPTVGPASTHSGQNCAGTILAGNYPPNANTRLISPQITLPNISGEEKLQLKSWHWFKTHYGYSGAHYDIGFIQIRVGTGNWVNITGQIWGNSPVWTQINADISAYAGQIVRLAFYFTSDGGYEDKGWYIDDISITKEVVTFINPEDFEQGIGDWSTDNGLWEVGKPTAGPISTHSGQKCAGTILGGNYTSWNNTRLISPEITLSQSVGITPELYFWHWFRTNSVNDKGYVQIKVGSGSWVNIGGPFSGMSPAWTQFYIDLSAYTGQTVRIAFYFTSDGGYEDNGWYIDDIRFPIYNNPPIILHSIPDIVFTEDSGPHPIVANLDSIFSDPDAGAVLTYQTHSNNLNVLASIQGKSLMVNSSQNYFGAGNVWVTATDNDGKSVSDTFLVTVTSVNDPPEINLPDSVSFINDENVTLHLWEYTYDVETPDSLLIYGFDVDTTALVLNYNHQTDELMLSAPGYVGTCYLFVTVTDDSNATFYDSVKVTVEQPVGIGEKIDQLPATYELHQNYPNPFNPTTNITFGLPRASHVRLAIFNILGQKIALPVDQNMPAGEHNVEFDGSSLSSGLYWYILQAGEFSQVRKMLLVR